jgi:Co/Zn/Cd efflux system component
VRPARLRAMQQLGDSRSDADGSQRLSAVRRAVLLTLALNLAVAVAKIVYGSMANALAIRADGFHSLTDSSNNLVGLVAIWVASRPPDRGHPYGHSKFEILAAGLVGLSLLAMAYDVARSAFHRMFSESAVLPTIDAGAFVVLTVTLAVNIGVARWERVQGERHGSAFLVSNAAHTRSDVLVTLGVIVATVLVHAGYPQVDLIAALAVSASSRPPACACCGEISAISRTRPWPTPATSSGWCSRFPAWPAPTRSVRAARRCASTSICTSRSHLRSRWSTPIA